MSWTIWPFAVKDKCVVCEQKNEFIATLLEQRSATCVGCDNSKAEVAYLREQNEKERQRGREEREEFKRAIDRLLEMAGSRRVGQGAHPEEAPKPLSVETLQSLFKEEGEA